MSSSSSSTSSFSSEEDTDNDNDLKPIKDYLADRREVAKQLFKSVKAEKIRMMLPQVLRKVEFNELEECCASELCGMSKKRIFSILNGTPMSDSSDTSDSDDDDSGPSLEIISDTEEWLTDDGPSVKQEPQSPSTKSKKTKNKSKNNNKNKNHTDRVKNNKRKMRNVSNAVKIKKEIDKNESKNQEGESLLDLLELEMRARAIRALIRKEEDIIPNVDSDQTKEESNVHGVKLNTNSSSTTTTTTTKNYHKSNETSETLVEKIGEDEDVVFLIKPTPTIELISSDSENENSNGRINKKFESERIPEREELIEDTKISDTESMEKNVEKPCIINEIDNDELEKKVCQWETKNVSISNDKTLDNDKNQLNVIEKQNLSITIDKQCVNDKKCSGEKAHDDKLAEYEEIIDLDDYPDDMDDIDTDECSKRVLVNTTKGNSVESPKDGEESIETWATRYYQTDSVQNVIKESKIQSEIRKRLRERQRLSKLNNSPREIPPANDDNELKPMGSVHEYLALKNSTLITTSNSNLLEKNPNDNEKDENETSEQQQSGLVSSTACSSSTNLLPSDKIDTMTS